MVGASCAQEPPVEEATDSGGETADPGEEAYKPQIDPADFTTDITANKYLKEAPRFRTRLAHH